jgi:tetratricopeptide (TPR) repeat protein
MIKFGDAMSVFGNDSAAPSADPHMLLKLCKDFTLLSQKYHSRSELDFSDDNAGSVLVHVAALGCQANQAFVHSLPVVAVNVEVTLDRLGTRCTLQKDPKFVARDHEIGLVMSIVDAVYASVAPAPRQIIMLRGMSGSGKTATLVEGLRCIQNRYNAAMCSQNVYVPGIIYGRSAATVQENFVRWGRNLGSTIGVSSGSPPETVLLLLKAFLQRARYVVLIDDADEAGMQEVLKHLPSSQLRCALLVSSQILQREDLKAYLAGIDVTDLIPSEVEVLDLQPFTGDECMNLIQRLCLPPNEIFHSFPSFAPLFARDADLLIVFEDLFRLPFAIRHFGHWLVEKYRDKMKDAKHNADAACVAFDEDATGATVMQNILAEWRTASAGAVVAEGAQNRLQKSVRLALQLLNLTPHADAGRQLLAMLSMCPSVKTPWSLFDGSGAGLTALISRGRRVLVKGQSLCYASVEGKSCRIPKLKLEAVVVSDELKEGRKVAVRLSDGKVINVQSFDLHFEGDAEVHESDGRLKILLSDSAQSRHQEGQIMRQHEDGSVSVIFQGPYEGCHVQLQGLLSHVELNGCFGYVCGACDSTTQLWPVKVTLLTGDTEMLLKASNLICTRQVMARDGNGDICAVPVFANGWLTKQRPGAEELFFRREDVVGVRVEGVLPDVTDALGLVAAALSSCGLVNVYQDTRTFDINPLIQRALRAELGDVHDSALMALLEARIGRMGDEIHVDNPEFHVMREILSSAAHIVGQMRAAEPLRASWVCGMRLRIVQVARAVIGSSFELDSYLDAFDTDWCAWGVYQRPVAAFRAMDWYRRSARSNERVHQDLISEILEALSLAPNAPACWDINVSLASAIHTAACGFSQRGKHDVAIEHFERALRIQIDTLGEYHSETAQTILGMGAAYGEKGQHDRAIDLFKHALYIQMVCFGTTHAETARTLFCIGVQNCSKGQLDQSVDFFQRALSIQMASYGEMHNLTAQTILGMGAAYGNMGQFDRSIELFERALSIQLSILGEMHVDSAGTILSLGTAYGHKRQYDRAIEFYERALSIQLATLGEMHSSTAVTISSMGETYGRKLDFDLAVKHLQRALDIFNATIGPQHSWTLQALQSLKKFTASARN